MAKLNHAFSMPVAPEQAKEQFQVDIGPELRHRGGFRPVVDESRRFVYSDGAMPVQPTPLGEARGTGERNLYATLRRLSARRIDVEFAPAAGGTRVTLRGSAERDVCASLEQLGSPGKWPHNREQVHAKREAEG